MKLVNFVWYETWRCSFYCFGLSIQVGPFHPCLSQEVPSLAFSFCFYFFQEELMGNLGSFRHLNFFQPFFAVYSPVLQEIEIWEALWWIFPEEINETSMLQWQSFLERHDFFFLLWPLGSPHSCWAHPALCVIPLRAAPREKLSTDMGRQYLAWTSPCKRAGLSGCNPLSSFYGSGCI